MDRTKGWVGCLSVLGILSLELLQFASEVLLEAGQRLLGQLVAIVVLLDKLNDVHKLLFTVEMIEVARSGDFVSDAIDDNGVLWHSLEDHRAEDCLLISYNKDGNI